MRLSTEKKASEPTIDWRRLRDFRNVFMHRYLVLDKELVWNAIEHLHRCTESIAIGIRNVREVTNRIVISARFDLQIAAY